MALMLFGRARDPALHPFLGAHLRVPTLESCKRLADYLFLEGHRIHWDLACVGGGGPC